jgi:hypothetical protein
MRTGKMGGFQAVPDQSILGPPCAFGTGAATVAKRHPPPANGTEFGGILATAAGLIIGTSDGTIFIRFGWERALACKPRRLASAADLVRGGRNHAIAVLAAWAMFPLDYRNDPGPRLLSSLFTRKSS